MKLVNSITLSLALLILVACGPRESIGSINLNGTPRNIQITEQDATISTSQVTIRVGGEIVEQSLLNTWEEEARRFGLHIVSKSIVIDGEEILVRREFRSGVTNTLLTYQFYDGGMLMASVPLVF